MLPTTTKQLYPTSATPDFWTLLLSVSTGDRNEHGNFILKRNLKPSEMAMMRSRAQGLAPWITPGSQGEIARAITQMMLGFAQGGVSTSEAKNIVTQYVNTLKDMPLWCVIRACTKFSNGEITEAELGGDKWDRSFRPSTAQLRRVAHSIVKPYAEESTRIFMTMRGTVGQSADPVERARVGEKLTAFAAELHAKSEAQKLTETAEDRSRKQQARQRGYQAILAEYRHRGVTPVYSDADKTIPIALGTLLASGWEIQDHPEGHEKILVKPAPQPAGKGREHYDRSQA